MGGWVESGGTHFNSFSSSTIAGGGGGDTTGGPNLKYFFFSCTGRGVLT